MNEPTTPSTEEKNSPNVKKYKCDHCSRDFLNRGNLVVHIRSLTVDKTCQKCGNSFSRRSDLRRHYLTHLDAKFYECEFCGAKFTEKITLDRHRRIHTGEKKYECETCKESFRYKCTLQRHMLKHKFYDKTQDKTFKCRICLKFFATRYNLKRHLKKVHGRKKILVLDT